MNLRRQVVHAALQAILDGRASFRDDAWFDLVVSGEAALPDVVNAFHTTADLRVKLVLLTVVNEYKSSSALAFLASVLSSPDDKIWKTALDGLVSVGGQAALEVLEQALVLSDPAKREWVVEAISQVRAGEESGAKQDGK
jgi:hypothetical protein